MWACRKDIGTNLKEKTPNSQITSRSISATRQITVLDYNP